MSTIVQDEDAKSSFDENERPLTADEDAVNLRARSPFRNFSADSGIQTAFRHGDHRGEAPDVGCTTPPPHKVSTISNTSPIMIISGNRQFHATFGTIHGHLLEALLMCMTHAHFGSNLLGEYNKLLEDRKEEELSARGLVESLQDQLRTAEAALETAVHKRKSTGECVKFLELKRRRKEKLMAMIEEDNIDRVPEDLREKFEPISLNITGSGDGRAYHP